MLLPVTEKQNENVMVPVYCKGWGKKTQQKVNFKNPSEVDLLLYKPQWFLEHWLMMSECLGLPRACTEMWPCGLGPYMGNFPSVTKVGNPGDTGPCLKLSLPPILSVFGKNTFSAGWIQQWFHVQHFLFDPMNWAGLGELCLSCLCWCFTQVIKRLDKELECSAIIYV